MKKEHKKLTNTQKAIVHKFNMMLAFAIVAMLFGLIGVCVGIEMRIHAEQDTIQKLVNDRCVESDVLIDGRIDTFSIDNKDYFVVISNKTGIPFIIRINYIPVISYSNGSSFLFANYFNLLKMNEYHIGDYVCIYGDIKGILNPYPMFVIDALSIESDLTFISNGVRYL